MELEKAINFLVEHVASIDANKADKTDLDEIHRGMDELRRGMDEARQTLRDGTKAIMHYTARTDTLLNMVTRGRLSLEEEVQRLKQRVENIEKRLPPSQAA